jgi:hypothetical protein
MCEGRDGTSFCDRVGPQRRKGSSCGSRVAGSMTSGHRSCVRPCSRPKSTSMPVKRWCGVKRWTRRYLRNRSNFHSGLVHTRARSYLRTRAKHLLSVAICDLRKCCGLAYGQCLHRCRRQPVTQRNNSPMNSPHQRNNDESQLGLPRPVCQEPDKCSPKACAMQQLAGNQRRSVGSVRRQPRRRPAMAAPVRAPLPALGQFGLSSALLPRIDCGLMRLV